SLLFSLHPPSTMLTARLIVLLVATLCTLTYGAEYDDGPSDFESAPKQFDSFPRALRSEMPSYSKKWANQVRFGKRSAGQRSWASQVRFG
ncbi:hypothetical protein PMAYCL1PPCAC_01775, partial [Pristionchus mayeri]